MPMLVHAGTGVLSCDVSPPRQTLATRRPDLFLPEPRIAPQLPLLIPRELPSKVSRTGLRIDHWFAFKRPLPFFFIVRVLSQDASSWGSALQTLKLFFDGWQPAVSPPGP